MEPISKRLCLIALSIALTTALPVRAEVDEKLKIKENKIKIKNDVYKIKIKGRGVGTTAASGMCYADPFVNLRKGSVVPEHHRMYLTPVPRAYMGRIEAPGEGIMVRHFRGRAYYLDSDTYRVRRIVTL